MRLSARNKLKGTIVEVKKGATTSHVRIDIGGAVVTASITNEGAALRLGPDRLCGHQGERRDGWCRLIPSRPTANRG
jgi:molybdopterin-binding protein